jgi:5-methyltetrahydrofolate--homocysteine methyltransferase
MMGLRSADRFRQALSSGRVLLMDGAMGTELQRAGCRPDECHEAWNLTHPGAVRAIHQAYAEAGAQCLVTNTFQAHPAALARHGLADQLLAIQRSALALARAAGGPDCFIICDIGPIVEPPSHEEFRDPYSVRWAVRGLRDADALLLETCSSPRVRYAVRWAGEQAAGPPVLLSLTYQKTEQGDLRTITGHAPEWFARRARGYGIAALGVNCGRDMGMDEIIDVVQRYRRHTDLPLFARPNAGTPAQAGGRWIYPHSPASMAARLPELLEAEVTLVGGCCGTTPAHIAAFRPIVEAWNARRGLAAAPP